MGSLPKGATLAHTWLFSKPEALVFLQAFPPAFCFLAPASQLASWQEVLELKSPCSCPISGILPKFPMGSTWDGTSQIQTLLLGLQKRTKGQLSGLLIPLGASASPINLENSVFLPTYFGSCPSATARPTERICLSCIWRSHPGYEQLLFQPYSLPPPPLGSHLRIDCTGHSDTRGPCHQCVGQACLGWLGPVQTLLLSCFLC